MDEIKRIISLSEKVYDKTQSDNGLVTLEFYNGDKKKVRILNKNLNTDFRTYVNCHVNTFTNDINDITTYDLKEVKDVI